MAEESIKVPIDGDTSGFEAAVGSMEKSMSTATVAMGTMLGDLGSKALYAFGDMIKSGDEFNQSINQLSASTGAVGDELAGLEDVVKGVYVNNFGDSYDDVANSVAEVKKQTGLVDDELQAATESAFALSDTFGYEVNESTKAASSLMENFGISADDAYNMIAVGAQQGADQNGNLLDTLNEYSSQYAALGLSAEQFTKSLITGAQEGAFDIDKVGDAVKEFNIRAKDGSDTSAAAFDAIGVSADEMTAKFASGGSTAQQAFFEVVKSLESMKDPVEKNAAAVGLFGTQYEDLEANLLPMLESMEDASGTAYDAMGQINEVKYNDVSTTIEGLKRQVQTDIIQPFSQKLMPKLKKGVDWTSDHLDGIVDTIKLVAPAVAGAFAVSKIVSFGTTAVKTIKTIKTAITMLNTSNPLGWIAIGLTTAVSLAAVMKKLYADADDDAVYLNEQAKNAVKHQQDLTEELESTREQYSQWVSDRDAAKDSVDTEYDHYEKLYDELTRITDENGNINDRYKERAQVIAGELNEALGTEITIVDGQIQNYQDLQAEIEKVIDLKRANALVDTGEESYLAAQSQLSENGQAFMDAQYTMNAANGSLQQYQRMQDDYEKLTKELGNYSAGTAEYTGAVTKFAEKYGNGKVGDFNVSDLMNNFTGVGDDINASVSELKENLDQTSEAYDEAHEKLMTTQSEIENYEALTAAIAGGNADEIEAATTRLQESLLTAKTGSLESLEQQYKDAEEYWQKIKLANESGVTGVTDSMEQSAYETYLICHEEFEDFKTMSREAGTDAAAEFASNFSVSMSDNLYQITDSMGNVSKAMSDAGYEAFQFGWNNGMQYTAGLAAGLNDPGNTLAAEEASKALMRQQDAAARKEAEIHSPSKKAAWIGSMWVAGLANSIRDNAGEATAETEAMMHNIIDTMDTGKMLSAFGSASDAIGANSVDVSPYVYSSQQSQTNPPAEKDTGDIIIPVSIGGQQLETVVVKAAQIANARSGGNTL